MGWTAGDPFPYGPVWRPIQHSIQEYEVPFPCVKQSKSGVDHPPSSSTRVDYGQSYTSTSSQRLLDVLRDNFLIDSEMARSILITQENNFIKERNSAGCSTVKHCRVQQKQSNVNESVISTQCSALYRVYS